MPAAPSVMSSHYGKCARILLPTEEYATGSANDGQQHHTPNTPPNLRPPPARSSLLRPGDLPTPSLRHGWPVALRRPGRLLSSRSPKPRVNGARTDLARPFDDDPKHSGAVDRYGSYR